MNQTHKEKENDRCQTYSWNKGGLKLFRFREYRLSISGSVFVRTLNRGEPTNSYDKLIICCKHISYTWKGDRDSCSPGLVFKNTIFFAQVIDGCCYSLMLNLVKPGGKTEIKFES